MRMLLACCLIAASPNLALAQNESPVETPCTRLIAHGWITDASHPTRPGQFRHIEMTVTVTLDDAVSQATIELQRTGGDEYLPRAMYYVRHGRIFQANDTNPEATPSSFGDLDPSTIAAIQPALVLQAVRCKPENLFELPAAPPATPPEACFAWNGDLWRVTRTASEAEPLRLRKQTHHTVHGDGVQEIIHENTQTSITERGREITRLRWEPPQSVQAPAPLAKGDPDRDDTPLIPAREMEPREVAPHVFAIEMPTGNARVFIAEFADHLVVFEGAYNSSNTETMAGVLHKRFNKPVRYFAFSHLHNQYIASTRAWVHAGATIVIPPSTEPLIHQIVAADFRQRPDALAREPREPQLQTVAERWSHADETNELVLYNIKTSDHTDEYFLLHFPRAGILVTGDLLFYRPGKPFTGRSLKLCKTIDDLGLTFTTAYNTWPLEMAGIKNMVTFDEWREARAMVAETAKPPAPPSQPVAAPSQPVQPPR